MRCYYHPKEEAVAVCRSCGKGICQQCTVLVEGNSLCRECVETRGFKNQMDRTAIPKPGGTPSKTPFIIGGVGAIISGVAAVLSIFGGIGSSFWLFGYYGYGYSTAFFSMMTGVLLSVGLILAGIGYKGIKTNYGRSIGTAGFALSIVSCVFFLIDAVLVIIARGGYYYYYYYNPWYIVYVLFGIIALELFAATQIVWGVAHINSRKYTGNSALGMATGILLIISGAFTASLLLAFVGMIMFLVGMILAMIVFLISIIPRSGYSKNTLLAPPP